MAHNPTATVQVSGQTGYDTDRFVECKEGLEEFVCGICQGVYREPKVTQCCGQTYCHTDIARWLTGHTSCPNCRKRLSVNQLLEPPKALKNLWSKLKIKCDYSDQGCEATVQLEDVSNHLSQCEFRPNSECKVCQVVRASVKDHNCIESLKRVNQSLRQKMARDEDRFDAKYKKLADTLKEKHKRELEALKVEVVNQMEESGKSVRRLFNKVERRADSTGQSCSNEHSYSSRNKRDSPDDAPGLTPNKRVRPLARIVLRAVQTESEMSASNSEFENDSPEEQLSEPEEEEDSNDEEPLSSESEQEESMAEGSESD